MIVKVALGPPEQCAEGKNARSAPRRLANGLEDTFVAQESEDAASFSGHEPRALMKRRAF